MAKNCETQHSNQHPSHTHMRIHTHTPTHGIPLFFAPSLLSLHSLLLPWRSKTKYFAWKYVKIKNQRYQTATLNILFLFFPPNTLKCHTHAPLWSCVWACFFFCDELLLCTVAVFARWTNSTTKTRRNNIFSWLTRNPALTVAISAFSEHLTDLEILTFFLLPQAVFAQNTTNIKYRVSPAVLAHFRLEYLDGRSVYFPPRSEVAGWTRAFRTFREPVHHFPSFSTCSSFSW